MRLLSATLVLGIVLCASCAKDPENEAGTGGTQGTGGKTSSGGVIGTGGRTGSGGATGTGGRTGSGGTTGSGGSTTTQPPTVDCTDVSTMSALVTGQYGGLQITTDNDPNKSYYMIANWWGNPPTAPQEQINGLGFTINGNVSAGSNVIGYPTIYIGNYQGKPTKGSNLPRQISALTSVPTIFHTNVDTQGVASYNAAYDVWLTANGTVSGTSPGAGGAFLMVWLFKPSDKQPRGTIIGDGRMIEGVPGTWTVWGDNTDPPCISYVSATKIAGLEFDLNLFIQDAVKQKYGNIKASQYLSLIFAGFEVWAGGDKLQLKKFCAQVK